MQLLQWKSIGDLLLCWKVSKMLDKKSSFWRIMGGCTQTYYTCPTKEPSSAVVPTPRPHIAPASTTTFATVTTTTTTKHYHEFVHMHLPSNKASTIPTVLALIVSTYWPSLPKSIYNNNLFYSTMRRHLKRCLSSCHISCKFTRMIQMKMVYLPHNLSRNRYIVLWRI